MFFKNEIKKRIKNEKGLTLIELLAVIVILAIIAAIAIPAIGNIIANSRAKAVVSDAQNILSAANMYFTDNDVAEDGTVTLAQLKDGGFIDDPGTITDTTVTKKTGGNTINFTAKIGDTTDSTGTGVSVSLKQLTSAEVAKGVISISAAGSGENGTTTAFKMFE